MTSLLLQKYWHPVEMIHMEQEKIDSMQLVHDLLLQPPFLDLKSVLGPYEMLTHVSYDLSPLCFSNSPPLNRSRILNVLQRRRLPYRWSLHPSTIIDAWPIFVLLYVTTVWYTRREENNGYDLLSCSRKVTESVAIQRLQNHLMPIMEHLRFSKPT